MGRGHVEERLLDPRRKLVVECPPQLAALDVGLDRGAHIVGEGILPHLRAQQGIDVVQQQGRNILRLLFRGIEKGDDRRIDLELDQRLHQVAHQAFRRQRPVAQMLDALAIPLAEQGDRALLQAELLEQLVLDRVVVERCAAGFHQLAIHRGGVADGIAHHEHVAHVVEQALRRLRPAREAFGELVERGRELARQQDGLAVPGRRRLDDPGQIRLHPLMPAGKAVSHQVGMLHVAELAVRRPAWIEDAAAASAGSQCRSVCCRLVVPVL